MLVISFENLFSSINETHFMMFVKSHYFKNDILFFFKLLFLPKGIKMGCSRENMKNYSINTHATFIYFYLNYFKF